MGALLWVLLAAAFAAWSLLALGANGLLAWLTETLMPHADILTGHPETVAWIGWAIHLAGDLGSWLVALVWALGTAGLIAGAWLLHRKGLRARSRFRLEQYPTG